MPALSYLFHLRPDDIPRLSIAQLTAYLDALDDLSRRR